MSDRCDYEFTTGEACQLESGHPGNHRWAAAQPPSGDAPALVDITGIDAIRAAVVEELEREGVITWADDGHRARFLGGNDWSADL